MSSALRTYVLGDGSLHHADHAITQAVLELAGAGYVSIAPDDDAYRSVLLTRTHKPAQDLLPEQELLLHALFGGVDRHGVGRRLHSPHQVPIAQTLMAITRQLLMSDGLIRKLKPQRVYRWLFWSFFVLAAITSAGVTLTLQSVEAFGLSLLGVFAAWMILFGFLGLNRIKYRRVFRTTLGQAELRKAASLPQPTLVARSSVPPSWWSGANWAKEADYLPTLAGIIGSALAQALPRGAKAYAPSEVLTLDTIIDRQLDLHGLTLDVSELLDLLDLNDWGADGDGGGGGGDGGDGGGDG